MKILLIIFESIFIKIFPYFMSASPSGLSMVDGMDNGEKCPSGYGQTWIFKINRHAARYS